MTVAAAVATVAPAGPEGKHGSYVDADEEYHRRETIAAAAAAAAAVACHHREIPYRRPFVGLRLPRPPRPQNHDRRQEHAGSEVQLAHPSPALVSKFRGPCVGSRRNG